MERLPSRKISPPRGARRIVRYCMVVALGCIFLPCGASSQQATAGSGGGGFMPPLEMLFPPPQAFLADPTNVLLTRVVEDGSYVEGFRNVLDAYQGDFGPSGIPDQYEAQRDFAIAAAAAEKAKEARQAIAAARRLSAVQSRAEVGLVQALVELRLGNAAGSRGYLASVCDGSSGSVLERVCAHLEAQIASETGDRAAAAAATRRARALDGAIRFPFDAIPASSEWDPVRVAHFDAMRKLHGPIWDIRGSASLEYHVGMQTLGNLVKNMKAHGASSSEALEAMRDLYRFEIAHNNFEKAGIWPNFYLILVGVEMAKENQPVGDPDPDLLLEVRKMTAQVALRLGSGGEAEADLVDEALKIVDQRMEESARIWALFGLASDLDVPENGEPAAQLFERVRAWSKAHPEEPLANVMSYSSGLRLIDIYARAGDLRRFEKVRLEMRVLALDMERGPFLPADGTRFHNGFVDLATAAAILKYSPTPERLIEAESLLNGVLEKVRPFADLMQGLAEEVGTVLAALEGEEEKPENADRGQEIITAQYIQKLIFPVLGRIFLKQERWRDASEFLNRALILDYFRRSVCADSEQASLGLDLAEALRRNGAADGGPLARDALLCLNTMDVSSPEVARALALEADRLREDGNFYQAEFAIARAIAIQGGLTRPGDRRLAGYYAVWADILIAEGDDGAALKAASSSMELIHEVRRQDWSSEDREAVELYIALAAKSKSFETMDLAFQFAQRWAVSQAGTALQAFSRRRRIADPAVARLLQQREELLRQRDLLDAQFTEIFGGADASDNTSLRDRLAAKLAALDQNLTTLDRSLDHEFLDHGILANPAPLTIAEVQSSLSADEALLFYADTPEALFFWVVTKGQTRFLRSGIGATVLEDMIKAARQTFGIDQPTRGALPVPKADGSAGLAIAHELYKALIAPVEAEIAGKALIVVPSGGLTSLPLHLLVANEGWDSADLRDVDWLVRRHATSVLPSVTSLRTLRRSAPASRDTGAGYLGIANPLLTGPSGTDRRAFAQVGCSTDSNEATVVRTINPKTEGISSFFRGGFADLSAVRALDPLPETVGEVCAVAKSLGGATDLLWGPDATESQIKKIDATGDLANYRILHFATHGLISGELTGLAEPALVLTPPADGTAEQALAADDGLLTASEVAELSLDADWIILSACNTAASSPADAEALSGLARAFFFAGSRSLLVSHWPVSSVAAVKLTTRAFDTVKTQPGIGRAEAMRRAMLSVIAEGGPNAEPEYWAPFILVGEGGAGR